MGTIIEQSYKINNDDMFEKKKQYQPTLVLK